MSFHHVEMGFRMGKWRFPTCSLVCQGAIWVPKYASINRLYHTLQMYLDFIRFMVSNCSKMYQNKKIIFHSSNLHKLCTMFFRNDSCSSLPQPGDRLARARRARRAWRARGAWPALLDSATRRQGGKEQRWGCGE